jgi:PAS domain S-box-containing protein
MTDVADPPRESEELFRAIFDSALDGMLIMDDAGRFLEANPAACALLGRTREQVLREQVPSVSSPELDFEETWRRFRDEGSATGHWRVVQLDGSVRDVEYAATADVLPGLHLSTLRDITARKRTEQELAASRRLLEDTQAVGHVGSWEWDLESNAVTWSGELYRLFGVAASLRALRYESFLEHVHPEERDCIDDLCREAAREGKDFAYDARIVRPDGDVRTIHARGRAVRNAAGRVARMIGVAQDITDRKRMEAERVALLRRLVHMQEEERRVISRELHDEVGQLLTGLRLMIEHSGTAGSGDRREEMKRVVNELIGRVRDLSMDLRPPMLDELGVLATLLWQIERFEKQACLAVNFRHANLGQRFPPAIELTVVRVVQEALTNVAKHAGVASVRVEVWANENALSARIEDQGRGFDATAAFGGQSSGLSGMRERCRALQGRLVIESTPGSGTRLLVELPLDGRDRGRSES